MNATFKYQGYLICPEFLTIEQAKAVVQDIDQLRELRTGGYAQRNSDTNGSALMVIQEG